MVMPESIVPGDIYRGRVSRAGAEKVRCSDYFYLLLPDGGFEGAGAYITVLSPSSDSVALAGEGYTLEVRIHALHAGFTRVVMFEAVRRDVKR